MNEREKVAHLLRRFAFGASEAELDYYATGGVAGAIQKLLNPPEDKFELTIDHMGNKDRPVNIPMVQAWWTLQLLTTRQPLREKLAVFWHDHFATSAAKVTQSPLMYAHVVTLRKGALGNFRDYLEAMSKDPAMLFWLDNQFNVAGKPNENFAREVMELFTLGIGHYSEKDVQEASRAFTGWNLRRGRRQEDERIPVPEFQFRAQQHDNGSKTVLGKNGDFGGEDVLDILCQHPQTARNIVTKMWEWFAYPKPEPALVERLASVFVRSNLEISVLVRAIMEAPEFYSAKAKRAIYKNPVDFMIPTLRQLGLGERVREQVQANPPADTGPIQGIGRGLVGAFQQASKGMGMSLLFPPDVAGWDTGPAWITSATMVERIGWADRLFGKTTPGSRKLQINYPAMVLFDEVPTPEQLADKLVSVFDAPITPAKRAILIESARTASGGRITSQNITGVAAGVARLIFGTPEFQMV